MIRKLLPACMLGVLACWMLQPADAQTTAVPVPSLVGSWQFTLAPASATATATAAGLATFTSDETVIETDTGVIGPAVAAGKITYTSPGHGIWQPGPAAGSDLYIQFINLIANPDGTLHAKRTLTATVTLNSNNQKFSGSYSWEIVNASGNVLSKGSGAITGELIPHPALP